MLSLKSPLQILDLIIFEDDSDEGIFYYISQSPVISFDENKSPLISAYAILPESGTVSVKDRILEAGLYVDVELSISDKDLDLAKKRIQEQTGKKIKRLLPAPINGGELHFIVANKVKEEGNEQCYYSFKPSLVGKNKGVVFVKSRGYEAELLIASASSDFISASIFYELELIGMSPVYHASITADSRMIYDYFEKYNKNDYLFYSEEVDNIIENLEKQNLLSVKIEETDPRIKAESMSLLLEELKETILETFFVCDFSDVKNNKSLVDANKKGILGILGLSIPGVKLSRKRIKRNELKEICIDLSQSNAKTYKIYPQSSLKSMLDYSKVDLSDRISWIKLDDLPYYNQNVHIRLDADIFSRANIQTVLVYCSVINSETKGVICSKNFPFNKSSQLYSKDFNYTREKGVKYLHLYKADIYMERELYKLPKKIEIDWQESESPFLYINPSDFYKESEVNLILKDKSVFNFSDMIQLELSLSSGESYIANDTLLFKKEDCSDKRISFWGEQNLPLTYDVTIIYFLSGGKKHLAEYRNLGDRFFFIPNPFGAEWEVELLCNADWVNINKVFLDTKIIDPDRETPIFNHFTFTEDFISSKLEAFCSADTPEKSFEYKISVLYKDYTKKEAGWYSHSKSHVLVLDINNMKSEKVIRAILDREVILPNHISYVKVFLKYSDNKENFITNHKILSFDNPISEYVLPSDFEYSYRFMAYDSDGLCCYKSKWQVSEDEVIKIFLPKDL